MNTGLLLSISILLWIWVCRPLNKKLMERKRFIKSNLFQLQQAYYHNSKLDRNKNEFFFKIRMVVKQINRKKGNTYENKGVNFRPFVHRSGWKFFHRDFLRK